MRSTNAPDQVIPQRELRNHAGKILREVAAGAHMRITVNGRPVADLIPTSTAKRFVSRSELKSILDNFPLDAAFQRDISSVLSDTIDEL